MPFKKTKDFEIEKAKECHSFEHNPPTHIYLRPGVYEYTCPECGAMRVITVPLITC